MIERTEYKAFQEFIGKPFSKLQPSLQNKKISLSLVGDPAIISTADYNPNRVRIVLEKPASYKGWVFRLWGTVNTTKIEELKKILSSVEKFKILDQKIDLAKLYSDSKFFTVKVECLTDEQPNDSLLKEVVSDCESSFEETDPKIFENYLVHEVRIG